MRSLPFPPLPLPPFGTTWPSGGGTLGRLPWPYFASLSLSRVTKFFLLTFLVLARSSVSWPARSVPEPVPPGGPFGFPEAVNTDSDASQPTQTLNGMQESGAVDHRFIQEQRRQPAP